MQTRPMAGRDARPPAAKDQLLDGAVLLPLGPWPGADVELVCEQGQWWGVGAGEGDIGRLRTRRVSVRLRGRGVAPAGRSARLLLPGPAGGPAAGAEGGVDGGVAVIDRPAEGREAG